MSTMFLSQILLFKLTTPESLCVVEIGSWEHSSSINKTYAFHGEKCRLLNEIRESVFQLRTSSIMLWIKIFIIKVTNSII